MKKDKSAQAFYVGKAALIVVVLMIVIFLGTGCKRTENNRHGSHVKGFAPPITFFDRFYDIVCMDKNIWVVGYFGKIVHSPDGGKTWTTQKSGTSKALLGISFVNDLLGWVVGDLGTVFHTKDGGKTWQKQREKKEEKLFGTAIMDGLRGVAVGTSGRILVTADGGTSWKEVASPTEDTLLKVQFFGNSEAFAIGLRGIDYPASVHRKDEFLTLCLTDFKRRNLKKSMESLKTFLIEQFGVILGGIERDEGCMVRVEPPLLGKDRVLLTGTAAGLLYLSGEGISPAIDSGYKAGKANCRALREDKNVLEIYDLEAKGILNHVQVCFANQPFLPCPA
jgi:hypothetical protein